MKLGFAFKVAFIALRCMDLTTADADNWGVTKPKKTDLLALLGVNESLIVNDATQEQDK